MQEEQWLRENVDGLRRLYVCTGCGRTGTLGRVPHRDDCRYVYGYATALRLLATAAGGYPERSERLAPGERRIEGEIFYSAEWL